jgi:hypothetical protein
MPDQPNSIDFDGNVANPICGALFLIVPMLPFAIAAIPFSPFIYLAWYQLRRERARRVKEIADDVALGIAQIEKQKGNVL